MLRNDFFKIFVLLLTSIGLISCEDEGHQHMQARELLYRDCGIHYNQDFDIKCYFFQSEKTDGFRIPVALLKNKKRQNTSIEQSQLNNKHSPPSLLIYMPGGPGFGLRTRPSEIQYWIDLANERKINSDILLYDPRGTGDGSLAWDCPDYRDRDLEALATWGFSEEYAQATDTMLRKCLYDYDKKIRARQTDAKQESEFSGLAAFSTHRQAFDSIEIAKALNYKTVHLWGVSYGTRTALMAAQSPLVKTLILDSPFPFQRGSISDMLALYDQSFGTHQQLYQSFIDSPTADFAALYENVSKRIQEGNISTTVTLDSGTQVPLTLTPHRLMQMIFSVLYHTGRYAAFYQGLNLLAEEGRISEDMQALLEMYAVGSVDSSFNHLVYHATRCSDDKRDTQAVLAEALKRYPRVAWYFSSTGEDLCQDPIFLQESALSGTEYIDKPTLIFSGQFDPVTPLGMAQELAAQLSRSKLVAIDGASHGLLFHIECDWQSLNHFWETTDLSMPVRCEPLLDNW